MENENIDPMTDTDRKVGEIVRRIKAELEMHRLQEEDMIRRVLREERGWAVKLVRDAATYILGAIKHL
jgi:hypothetical protein